MRNATTTEVQARVRLAALCLGVLASACGPIDPSTEPLELDEQQQELVSDNGLTANGLTANGLTANGLTANGLTANGLTTQAFTSWFHQDPALANMVMTYVVRCAVPAGQTRSYTHPQTGKTYTWAGELGLTPGWSQGQPANLNEQQVLTSCLLSHVNRFGVHLTISILGLNAGGQPIPFTNTELSAFKVREACFFGNLFVPNSLFFGIDKSVKDEHTYITRACGPMTIDTETDIGTTTQCSPLRFVGTCSQRCTKSSAGPFYTSCTFNGVSYRPMTTRMLKSDYEALFPDEEDEDWDD